MKKKKVIEEKVYNVEYIRNRGIIKYHSNLKEGSQYIYLTKTQIILFNILLMNGDNITPRKELFKAIYKLDDMTRQDDITLNLSMCRLRERVRPVADIICKKKTGFKLVFKGVELNEWTRD